MTYRLSEPQNSAAEAAQRTFHSAILAIEKLLSGHVFDPGLGYLDTFGDLYAFVNILRDRLDVPIKEIVQDIWGLADGEGLTVRSSLLHADITHSIDRLC